MPSSSNEIPLNNDHYTLKSGFDFLNNNVSLLVTEQSIELFNKAPKGTGFVFIVELPHPDSSDDPQIVKIHLIPSYNKDDGLIYGIDSEGKELRPYLYAFSAPLGSIGGGVIHTQGVATLGLGDKISKGLLMGGGIWKSGAAVRFLDELPPREGRIPDDYLLIRDKVSYDWKLYYVKRDQHDPQGGCNEEPRDISSIPGLQEALDQLPRDKELEQLTFKEREVISNILIKSTAQTNNRDGIKFCKNRSSSLNVNAFEYTGTYQTYFRYKTHEHGAHSLSLPREIPLLILEKIMVGLCTGLNIPIQTHLSENSIIPRGRIGPRGHLIAERMWLTMKRSDALGMTLNSPLKYAIDRRDIEQVKTILGNLDPHDHLFIKACNIIYTPLLYAVSNNSSPDIVEFILELGVNPNVPCAGDKSELYWTTQTALYFAVMQNDIKKVRLLLKFNADPYQLVMSDYEVTSRKNDTPFCRAIRKGNSKIVSMFLEKTRVFFETEQDLDIKKSLLSMSTKTAIDFNNISALKGLTDIVDKTLDDRARNSFLQEALEHAVTQCNRPMLDFLLKLTVEQANSQVLEASFKNTPHLVLHQLLNGQPLLQFANESPHPDKCTIIKLISDLIKIHYGLWIEKYLHQSYPASSSATYTDFFPSSNDIADALKKMSCCLLDVEGKEAFNFTPEEVELVEKNTTIAKIISELEKLSLLPEAYCIARDRRLTVRISD